MGARVTGIDFGTSTTLVATREGEAPALSVPIGRASSWMPTIAAVDDRGRLVIGEQAAGYPGRTTLRSVKSLLAQGDEIVTLHPPDGRPIDVKIDDVVVSILEEAADRAAQAGHPLAGPVRLACPANWAAEPRLRLVELAGRAGLDVSIDRVLDEPIAAGISWVMNRWFSDAKYPQGRAIVFDYGGGTLDVAVIDVKDVSPPEITVLSALGLSEAGDRLDETIARELVSEYEDTGAILDDEARTLVRMAATRLKEALTTVEAHETPVGGSGRNLPPATYTRARAEDAFRPQLDRAIAACFAALRSAELRRRGVDTSDVARLDDSVLAGDVRWVLMAGGLSRVPAVRARLIHEFPHAEVAFDSRLGAPEESVVSGLTFENVVQDLNLHRPAFDFVAEVVDRRGDVVDAAVLYPAFSPLYRPDEIFRGETHLGYPAELRLPAGVHDGVVKIACRAVDGTLLDLQVDGTPVPRIDMPITSRRPFVFKLYVDGRVLLRAEQQRMLRVDRWPVLHGKRAPIAFVEEHKPWSAELEPGWWHYNRD